MYILTEYCKDQEKWCGQSWHPNNETNWDAVPPAVIHWGHHFPAVMFLPKKKASSELRHEETW